MKDAMKLETQLVVAGRDKRYTQGAVNPVIQRASSLVFDTVKDKKFATANRANGELFYGRRGTYTHFAFQKAMSELEGGVGCALYPCGAAAVTNAILAFVEGGDHILMTGAAYEPTQDFCNKILSKFNVETTYYDPLIGAGIVDLLRPETKVVFLESPSSITMEVQDVPGMVKAIRAVNPEIVIMIDNTWAAGRAVQSAGIWRGYFHSGGNEVHHWSFGRHAGHGGVQRSLLGSSARELLFDGANAGCRYGLQRQPRIAYPGGAS
ncbi:cystathionine beta-lyase [Citrobacter freundii]|nr:cystathionine beta-lyase [Citrobacter freundii]